MQQNTTDSIAKIAWQTTTERWKEFMVLPIAVGMATFLVLGILINYSTPVIGMGGVVLLSLIFYVAAMVFASCFMTAVAKWCSDIYEGKKTIDIKEGLRYGLSRFWGVLGTQVLTGLKVFLWSLLLVIPGVYKAIMYSQSAKISQLEGVSGGDANRMSQILIKESGILRTLGNCMSIQVVSTLFFELYLLAVGIVWWILSYTGSMILTMGIGGLLVSAGMVVMMTFMLVFLNFQYLIYREENKAEMASLAKTLKSMK